MLFLRWEYLFTQISCGERCTGRFKMIGIVRRLARKRIPKNIEI
jgi:hypothetical protein